MRINSNGNIGNGIVMGYNGYDGFIEYEGSGSLLINYTSQKPITLGGSNTTVSVPGTLAIGGVVGIGTAPNPNYALSVCGSIHCTKVRVEPIGSWCDYVFSPDYKLMSWDSLMKYIRSKGHLPNIPSEDEVLTYGIEVSHMLKVLLEKIEEMYLYMDELYKRVEYLEQRNQELEKMLETMRKYLYDLQSQLHEGRGIQKEEILKLKEKLFCNQN